MRDFKYIAVEGNIGSGKTTLARKLADHFDYDLVLEKFEDNSYLPKFYKDPVRNAFPLEMSFLAERYKQLNTISRRSAIISDYVFAKSWLFASINLENEEARVYYNVFNILQNLLPQPDRIVFLESDIETLLRRIRKRGRDYEQKIQTAYLEKIQRSYNSYFTNKRFPGIIRIDINETDLSDAENFSMLIKAIIV